MIKHCVCKDPVLWLKNGIGFVCNYCDNVKNDTLIGFKIKASKVLPIKPEELNIRVNC